MSVLSVYVNSEIDKCIRTKSNPKRLRDLLLAKSIMFEETVVSYVDEACDFLDSLREEICDEAVNEVYYYSLHCSEYK